jgi:hypothetical protein
MDPFEYTHTRKFGCVTVWKALVRAFAKYTSTLHTLLELFQINGTHKTGLRVICAADCAQCEGVEQVRMPHLIKHRQVSDEYTSCTVVRQTGVHPTQLKVDVQLKIL